VLLVIGYGCLHRDYYGYWLLAMDVYIEIIMAIDYWLF
jgi:hypothetical protein